jgi:hypothetical protein
VLKPFLDQLPDKAKLLVAEVESAIAKEIRIRPRTDADLDCVPDPRLAICDCFVFQGGLHVEIALPAQVCPVHTFIHEILHAHRNMVQQVHRLVGTDARSERFAMRINNDLEHLFVIPAEIELVPEAIAYWYDHYDEQLEAAIADLDTHPLARRDNLLRHRLVTALTLPDWKGSGALKEALKANGWGRDADNLVRKIQVQLPDKQSAVSTMLRFLGLDRSRYATEQYLVARRDVLRTPICAE